MRLVDAQKKWLEKNMKKKCVKKPYLRKISDTWKQQTMSRFERVE